MDIERKNNLSIIVKSLSLGDHENDCTINLNDIEKNKAMNMNLIFVKFELIVKHSVGGVQFALGNWI